MHEIGKMGGRQEGTVGGHFLKKNEKFLKISFLDPNLAGVDHGGFHDGTLWKKLQKKNQKLTKISKNPKSSNNFLSFLSGI